MRAVVETTEAMDYPWILVCMSGRDCNRWQRAFADSMITVISLRSEIGAAAVCLLCGRVVVVARGGGWVGDFAFSRFVLADWDPAMRLRKGKNAERFARSSVVPDTNISCNQYQLLHCNSGKLQTSAKDNIRETSAQHSPQMQTKQDAVRCQ
jgi:hypothetical protein